MEYHNIPLHQKLESTCHTQVLNRIQNIFPNMILPKNMLINNSGSFSQLLENISRSLPKPHAQEIPLTINNMKQYVDSQQLRIQRNMIELQEHHRNCVETSIYQQRSQEYFQGSSQKTKYFNTTLRKKETNSTSSSSSQLGYESSSSSSFQQMNILNLNKKQNDHDAIWQDNHMNLNLNLNSLNCMDSVWRWDNKDGIIHIQNENQDKCYFSYLD